MMKQAIWQRGDDVVEYETENGYMSVVRTGNMFAVGIKGEYDELEDFIDRKQAEHLAAFLSAPATTSSTRCTETIDMFTGEVGSYGDSVPKTWGEWEREAQEKENEGDGRYGRLGCSR